MKAFKDIELFEIVEMKNQIKTNILKHISEAIAQSHMSPERFKQLPLKTQLFTIDQICKLNLYRDYKDLEAAQDIKSQMISIEHVENMF